MDFRFSITIRRKQNSRIAGQDVPKGYFVAYVGGISHKKRFVVPMTYLNDPVFQDLLSKAEDEFGYDHPMGGIIIPCTEHSFLDLINSFY